MMTRIASLVIALLIFACGEGREPSTWEVRGTVRDVAPGGHQILIEHEAIPDLMPAMTMNFDVANPVSASQLRAGEPVVFTLEYTHEGLRILRIAAIGAPEPGAEGSSFRALVEAGSLAPEFVLVDQAGAPFALRDLRGKAVLLDFIFTNCPGPCPLQTASHVRLHRTLDPSLREQTHLVSVSLDPARDTPEALLAYAERLGVDLDGWSFLSGTPSEVDAVLSAYGVGRIASDDAGIDHMLVTYLIDPDGRVAQRYLGSAEAAEELRLDIQAALASLQGEGRAIP